MKEQLAEQQEEEQHEEQQEQQEIEPVSSSVVWVARGHGEAL